MQASRRRFVYRDRNFAAPEVSRLQLLKSKAGLVYASILSNKTPATAGARCLIATRCLRISDEADVRKRLAR
jgi:hypothetical protein